MKTILLSGFLLLGVSTTTHAQATARDSVAVMILDRMADNIGAMHSCSFHLETAQDVLDSNLGTIVKRHRSHEVSLVGPDKMLVHSTGEGSHRGYWYDGAEVTYYSFDENNFARVPAPPTIVAAIDSVHNDYGIDFPAADFIYPTFVSDLIDQSDRIVYRGLTNIGGKECFQIATKGPTQDVQIWIANDATNLPVKYVIRDKAKDSVMEFEGDFSDWQINPDLPLTIFSFMPPPGAHEVAILARDRKISGGKP